MKQGGKPLDRGITFDHTVLVLDSAVGFPGSVPGQLVYDLCLNKRQRVKI